MSPAALVRGLVSLALLAVSYRSLGSLRAFSDARLARADLRPSARMFLMLLARALPGSLAMVIKSACFRDSQGWRFRLSCPATLEKRGPAGDLAKEGTFC